jgi:transposase-like protein
VELSDMSPDKDALIRKGSSWVLPMSLPYLNDNSVAHDLIDNLRWEGQKRTCPRCESGLVTPVNTNLFRELYRCVDCNYMFNSLAGTVFQGSKMPVQKYFHFFILHNAFGDDVSLRDVCFTLDCTFKTASLWLKRCKAIKSEKTFAILDRKLAASIDHRDKSHDPPEDAFFSFCDMKGILVNEALFLEYIQGVCQNKATVGKAQRSPPATLPPAA